MRSFLFFFILLVSTYVSMGQSNIVLDVQLNTEENKAIRLLDYKKKHKDSIAAIKELQKVVQQFHRNAYIVASVDSLLRTGDSLIAYLNTGNIYKWTQLKRGNVNDVLLNKVGFKDRFYRNKKFYYTEYAELAEAFLKYSERHGYPFSTFSLDSIKEMPYQSIEANMNYQPGPVILFDSIEIIGKVKIKKKFLVSYLRIFPETPYNQDKVNSINRLLKELIYLKQTKPYQIVFADGRAIIKLFLEDKKANQADGIVGFLPNTTNNNKLLVTGELNVGLKNLFSSGKNFTGEWRRFNQASQLLNLSYLHPRLFRSNLDVRLDFNLLKQDSTFLTIERKVAIYQRAGRLGVINFSGGLKTSRELISDNLVQPSSLPSYSNYDLTMYGMGYSWNNLDDIFFPHKGWSFNADIIGGNKKIIKSAALPDSLFNSVALNSVQFNFTSRLEKYIAIKKRSVLLVRSTVGNIYNNKDALFYNDLYRLGGLKTLRGFAENFYYASTYVTGTIEYRFFTDESSYLLLFIDQGYIKNSVSPTLSVDKPTGIGAGVSFSTGAGIFNFIYSLGNSSTQKMNLNQSKIHFGIVTRF